MTIQTDNRETSVYGANGQIKSFPYDFPVFKGDNGQKGLEVRFIDDLGYSVVDPSEFTVIQNTENTGGIVQFYTAPVSGKKIIIVGSTPIDQQLDITNYSRFNGESIEANFDKIIAIAQEFLSKLKEEIRQRINNDLDVKDFAEKKMAELQAWATSQLPELARNQFDLMFNDFKKEWEDALNTITTGVGIPAISVYDSNGLNQQEFNNKTITTVESIADLLAIKNPKDRQVVNAKGYYKATNFALAQPYKGGDLFYYVASLSSKNNGITVFNGWVRDTSDKLLTTDDAGLLGDGNDANATVRLQNIFSAVDDGFTIQIIGKYTINQHVMAYRKKDLKIIGVNSDIQGDPDNWIWKTSNIVPDVAWYHPRGILMAYDCPNVSFAGFKIKGINRPNKHGNADQWQDGDCAFHTYRCDNATFANNITTNNYAWGICNEIGINGTAYGNNISFCTHQSGINICNGASSGVGRVYNNTITECGLYGIEYENRNTYDIECYGNTVLNSYAGLMALSDNNALFGKLSNNIVSNCFYGIYPANLNNANNKLRISENDVSDSYYGTNLSSASGLSFTGNTLNGFFTKDTYLHISPSNYVAEVLAPNQFLTERSLITEFGAKVDSVYYINEQQITITALVANTAAWKYGNTAPSNFYVITIAESILDETFLFRHLKRKFIANSRCYIGMQNLGGNKNNVISGNTIRGFAYGILKDRASTGAEFNEIITNNTFIEGDVDVLNTTASMGIKYIDNNFTGNLGFHRDLVEKGNVTLHPVVSQKLGIARATTSEAVKSTAVYLPQRTRINAVSISVIGMNTTGKLRVGINNQTLEAATIGNNVLLYCNHLLDAGAHTVTISDSVGDLTYIDVFLSLLSA